MLLEAHFPQTVWVEGAVPASWPGGPVTLTINYYHAGPGYDTETLLGSDTVEIAVRNVVLPPLTESPFYLDLWQHPSCLARYYQVPLWSDEHFAIIGHYLTELASLGEKVITTILSDYPWGGQSCDLVPKNASNLFEYNMVALRRDPQGQLHCDFTAFDRYVETAFASGITQEIDLFGLVGNWDRRAHQPGHLPRLHGPHRPVRSRTEGPVQIRRQYAGIHGRMQTSGTLHLPGSELCHALP